MTKDLSNRIALFHIGPDNAYMYLFFSLFFNLFVLPVTSFTFT